MKTYKMEVTYKVKVKVEAQDEETAVVLAMEKAPHRVADGLVEPLVEIISER